MTWPDPMRERGRCPVSTLTPCLRCASAKYCPTSVPSVDPNGTVCGSTTVTGQPYCQAAAATSSPIQPPPITATGLPVRSAARIRSESRSSRR